MEIKRTVKIGTPLQIGDLAPAIQWINYAPEPYNKWFAAWANDYRVKGDHYKLVGNWMDAVEYAIDWDEFGVVYLGSMIHNAIDAERHDINSLFYRDKSELIMPMPKEI